MGAASGVTQAGMFTGAMTGPAIFGVVADNYGFGWSWLIVACFSATAAVLMFTASRLAGSGVQRRIEQ